MQLVEKTGILKLDFSAEKPDVKEMTEGVSGSLMRDAAGQFPVR
jgi:hypothetical protein